MFDVVVIGAGSSGSVVASRASENPSLRVLLVEAGPDYPGLADTPRDLVNGHHNSTRDHDWGLAYEPTPTSGPRPFPRGRVTGGHTAGHQALLFTSEGQTAVYPGDLCPMASHVPSHWCMAYDVDPLRTRRQKPLLLGQAADQHHLVLWDHDPAIAACYLQRDERREFCVAEAVDVL